MKKINVNELNDNSNVICLDDKKDYDKNYIKGSVNIPYEKMANYYRELLNKNDRYYFYCKSGIKSKRMVTMLEYLGYDVVMIEK